MTKFISSQRILNIYNSVLFQTDFVCSMLCVFLINATMAKFCFRTAFSEHIHEVCVLCPSCVPEKVGANQKYVNQS
jgi:hypothetical protein